MELTSLFRALMRRKWIILACVVAASAIAFVLTMNMPKTYKSTAQLSTGFTVTEELKLSNENFNVPQIDMKFNNVIENITSPRVLSLVSYHLMYHDLQFPEPFTRLTEKDKEDSAYKNMTKERALAMISSRLDSFRVLNPAVREEKQLLDYLKLYKYDVESLLKKVVVGRAQRTDYINIVCYSHNPNLSAYVVNTLCDEFKRFYGLDKRQRTDQSIVGLDSLVQSKRKVLEDKMQEKNQFMSSQGVVDVNMEGSNKLSQISSYENQLIEERANQQNLEYKVQQLSALINNAQSRGLTSVIASDSSRSARNNGDYIKLRDQYNKLYSQYMESGGKDVAMKNRLDEISRQMREMNVGGGEEAGGGGDAPVSLDNLIQQKVSADGQLKASRQKTEAIESMLRSLKSGLGGMAATGATIQQYDKEIQIASDEYTAAKDQLNMALNMSESGPGSFQQTLVGTPALNPEPSRRLLILMASGLSAFFLASLAVIFLEFIDQSVKTPSQFLRVTGLPMLGTVNKIRIKSNRDVLESVANFDESEKHRNNTMLELLRKLRYEIESSGKQIFLFTSTEPQQGKTALIQAISYILSLSKKKVLILDTNFCNNDLTLATKATPALEKFELNGKPFDVDDVKSLITHSSAEFVDIIGCEGGDYTPSEILPKNHLLNYLDQLKKEYDFIFLEGAPLNGFTDTKELMRYAEGLIAVFSAESSFTPADRESISFLKEHKDKFIGAILNKVDTDNIEL